MCGDRKDRAFYSPPSLRESRMQDVALCRGKGVSAKPAFAGSFGVAHCMETEGQQSGGWVARLGVGFFLGVGRGCVAADETSAVRCKGGLALGGLHTATGA